MTLTVPTDVRAVARRAAALLAVGGLLVGLVAAPAPAAAADVTSTREYPVAVRCETFGDDGQHCGPYFDATVEPQGVLRVRFVASPQGCSDFGVSFFQERVGGLPGAAIPRSGGDFLAPGASSREVSFGESNSPGQYRVWVWAHGRPGGCNTGRLESWGGTLYVTTSGPAAAPAPSKPDLAITRVTGPTEVFDGTTAVYEVALWNEGTPARGTAQVLIGFLDGIQAEEMVETPAGFTCERGGPGFSCTGSLGGVDDAVQTRGALFKARGRADAKGSARVYGSANHDRSLDEGTVDNNLTLLEVTVK